MSSFLSGTCKKTDPRSRVVKSFASSNFERLLSILGMGKASFTVTEFRYRKSPINLSWSLFFLAITTPHAHSDLDGSIISYSSNVSISFLHASDLCGVMRLAPFLCGTADSSSSISCSTKLQHPMSALCLEKTS